jgi:hypothetical protein
MATTDRSKKSSTRTGASWCVPICASACGVAWLLSGCLNPMPEEFPVTIELGPPDYSHPGAGGGSAAPSLEGASPDVGVPAAPGFVDEEPAAPEPTDTGAPDAGAPDVRASDVRAPDAGADAARCSELPGDP